MVRTLVADRPGTRRPDSFPQSEEFSAAAGPDGAAARAGVGIPAEEPPADSPSLAATVDPAVLTAALAAIAPAIPEAHRRSLAEVLRALAGALDPG